MTWGPAVTAGPHNRSSVSSSPTSSGSRSAGPRRGWSARPWRRSPGTGGRRAHRPPTAPEPSSVGTPRTAVKLRSLPLPSALPSTPGSSSFATGNSSAGAGSGIEGRPTAPWTEISAPPRCGARAANADSMRSFSSAVSTRTSTTVASAGTTLSRVPADATVGVTVVPTPGRPGAAMSRTRCEASIRALTPAPGSGPTCDARPVTVTSNVPQPLRPVFRAPSSAAPPKTSTAPRARARSSMRAREAFEDLVVGLRPNRWRARFNLSYTTALNSLKTAQGTRVAVWTWRTCAT